VSLTDASDSLKTYGTCHQAAESIAKIAGVLSTPQIEEFYIPLLKRLSQGEFFTSRTSSAALYPPVYSKVSWLIQEDLRKGFAALGADDTPMVRRAAAKWLGVRDTAIFCFFSGD
jgi:serine/threonine-protein phosphatase 2A regulatory subunit A